MAEVRRTVGAGAREVSSHMHVGSSMRGWQTPSGTARAAVELRGGAGPGRTMRSASSRHRYRQRSSVMRRLARKSLRRPGVHTAEWMPRRSASAAPRMSSPPTHSRLRSSGQPAAASAAACAVTMLNVCRASSREGHTTSPTGPSPCCSGIRHSSCRPARQVRASANLFVVVVAGTHKHNGACCCCCCRSAQAQLFVT